MKNARDKINKKKKTYFSFDFRIVEKKKSEFLSPFLIVPENRHFAILIFLILCLDSDFSYLGALDLRSSDSQLRYGTWFFPWGGGVGGWNRHRAIGINYRIPMIKNCLFSILFERSNYSGSPIEVFRCEMTERLILDRHKMIFFYF